MVKYITISWNGATISTTQMPGTIKKLMNRVENSVQYGIREGASKTINDGKEIAQFVLKANDSMGPGKVLFNSIKSSQLNKDNFYLIAGVGTGADQMYPLYIEKGFKPHFVPTIHIRNWLVYRGLLMDPVTGKERRGIWVGRDEKWRTGIGFMQSAFEMMRNNLNVNVRNGIIKTIEKNLSR